MVEKGSGPARYQALVHAVLRGEVSLDYAVRQAAPPAFADELSLDVVVALGNAARSKAESGQWRDAVTGWRILLEAVGPRPDGRFGFNRHQVAVADWIYIVTEAVKDVPDGELFRSAAGFGEQAFSIAERQASDRWRSIQLSRLGALHFLPYAQKIASDGDLRKLRWWQQRGRDTHGGSDRDMPEPRDALRSACGYFRRMIEVPDGERGFGFKCLAQALELRRILGDDEIILAEIVALARQALDLLHPDERDWRLELLELLRRADQAVSLTHELHGMGNTPADRSSGAATEDGLAALRISSHANAADAVPLAERLWKAAAVTEARRVEIANLYGNALAKLLEPMRLFPSGIRAKFTAPGRAFDRAAAILTERLAQDTHDDAGRFRALLGLAVASARYDAEAKGLDFVSAAHELRAAVPAAAADISSVLAALIAIGAGVNEWSRQAWVPAAKRYFQAAELCARAQLTDHARDALLRGMEALERAQFPADLEAIIALAGIAPLIEAADSAGRVTQNLFVLWNRYLELALERSDNPGFSFILLQAAKGAQFSTSLDEGRRQAIGEDPAAADLLVERMRLLPLADPPRSSTDDVEFFLAGVDAPGQQEGATAEERLMNVERAFDALVQQRITAPLRTSNEYVMGIEEAFDLLDDRSALLILHSGRTKSDQMAQRLFLATKRRQVTFGQNMLGPAIAPTFGIFVNDIAVDDLGTIVASCRSALQSEGELADGSCDTEGGRLLRVMRKSLLGGLEPTLRKMRADGIDHLAICAHGSTHFLPWHLLLNGEIPLADEFVVTYLPSLALLRPKPDPASRERRTVAAFGVTFEDENIFGLSELASVRDELGNIAGSSGADIYLDADATELAFASAMCEARRIHVATHGEQCASAPAFHRLYLTPDGDSDGVLHAYEILSRDLRGLDLITLSACETALGRIDRSDNLRGLPAALFQAGAATIIGTLWAVLDEAAALFFGTLYERLAQGNDKLSSFSAAQDATRRAFPQFRDWGAFHFSGRW